MCCTHMLQVFYQDVCVCYNGFTGFSGVLTSVSDTYLKCFIHLYTDVASVIFGCLNIYRVLHLSTCLLLPHLDVSSSQR